MKHVYRIAAIFTASALIIGAAWASDHFHQLTDGQAVGGVILAGLGATLVLGMVFSKH
jgi:hypothetical protein